MWASGISYPQMGYVTDLGEVPAWKLDEHNLCQQYVEQARRDKDKGQ